MLSTCVNSNANNKKNAICIWFDLWFCLLLVQFLLFSFLFFSFLLCLRLRQRLRLYLCGHMKQKTTHRNRFVVVDAQRLRAFGPRHPRGASGKLVSYKRHAHVFGLGRHISAIDISACAPSRAVGPRKTRSCTRMDV